jgi:hypothetical protein
LLVESVLGLVRARQSTMVDVLSVFQVASSRAFVAGDVDMGIRYAQLVQLYGPASRRQWGYAILYALRVYKAFMIPYGELQDGLEDDGAIERAQEAYEVLDEESRSHPFVMTVRLLHLKERCAVSRKGEDTLRESSDGGATGTTGTTGMMQRRPSSERRSWQQPPGTLTHGLGITRAPSRRSTHPFFR